MKSIMMMLGVFLSVFQTSIKDFKGIFYLLIVIAITLIIK